MSAVKFPLTIRESEFQRTVMELAHLLRWKAYHTHRSEHSPSGFPDLVLVRGVRVIFAELKSDAGQPTPAQNEWITALGRVPCAETYLWRPRDFDAIRKVLQ